MQPPDPDDAPTSRVQSAWAILRAAGPLTLFTVLGPAVGAAVLAATADAWFPPLDAGGVPSSIAFALVAVLTAGLSLVPTHAVSLVAGLLYGGLAGSALALTCVTAAAALGFLAARGLVGERWLAPLAERPRARAVHAALVQRGRRSVGLIALVRLSPVMPFAATNLLLAAARVAFPLALAGTVLGLAPRVVAVALIGAGLSELDLSRSGDRWMASAGLAATLLAVVGIGRVARTALRTAVTDSD